MTRGRVRAEAAVLPMAAHTCCTFVPIKVFALPVSTACGFISTQGRRLRVAGPGLLATDGQEASTDRPAQAVPTSRHRELWSQVSTEWALGT